MITSSVEAGHAPLVIVHLNVLAPTPSAVNPDVGEEGVVIVPAPAISVHVPVPTAGAFPAKVAVVAHTFWSGPAADVVGLALTVIT